MTRRHQASCLMQVDSWQNLTVALYNFNWFFFQDVINEQFAILRTCQYMGVSSVKNYINSKLPYFVTVVVLYFDSCPLLD